jgi:hypothetical protein
MVSESATADGGRDHGNETAIPRYLHAGHPYRAPSNRSRSREFVRSTQEKKGDH